MKRPVALRKNSEFVRFFNLLVRMGIAPKLFWQKDDMVTDEAVKLGAIVSVQVNGYGGTDFNFDKSGRFVGHNTDSVNSFRKRLGGKRGRRKSTGRAKNSRRSEGSNSVRDAITRIKQITY